MKRKIFAVLTACLLAVSGCACGAQKPEEDDSLVVITSHVLTGDAATPEELLADMSLREKIGQMLMPDFSVYGDDTAPVYELNNAQTTAIAMDHFGGILLFSENIKDAEQTAKLIDAMQAANARTGRTALLIAADNEGGQISRLTMGTMLCGNMALGAANSEELTEEAAGLLSGEMAALGINVNFAPSLDVNSNPANPVIGVRSFSDDPQIVTRLGKAYVRGVQGKGIIPAVKHFPGHGNTETDSHTGLPRIDKSIAKLEECELIPFREAVESGVDILMTAHIQFPQIETDTYTSRKDGEQICLPATLSDDILTKMVRERFGYEGIIVTDAMNMDAIKENFAPLDAAKLAINAGVDMLLMPVATITDEQIYAVTDYIGGIEKLVESGEIPESRIDESVLRILKLKERYGLLTPLKPTEEETAAKAKAAAESVGSKANHEQEWDIAKQAVTLVKNEDDLLPLDGSGKTVMLCPYASEINSLEYAAEKLKADGKIPKDAKIVCESYEDAIVSDIAELIDGADTVVAVSAVYNEQELNPASEDGKGAKYLDSLLEKAHDKDIEVVLVSAQLPYDIARYPDADAALACYLARGMTDKPRDFSGTTKYYGPNLITAIYTVFGGNAPTGKLPVNIPEIDDSYQYTEEILYKRGTGLSYSTSDEE